MVKKIEVKIIPKIYHVIKTDLLTFAHECYVQNFTRAYYLNGYLIAWNVTPDVTWIKDSDKPIKDTDIFLGVFMLISAFYTKIDKKAKFLVYDLKNLKVELYENHKDISPLDIDNMYVIPISTLYDGTNDTSIPYFIYKKIIRKEKGGKNA